MMFIFDKCTLIFFLLSALVCNGCKDDQGPVINPRNFEDVMQVDGLPRSFIVNLPPQYEKTDGLFPLIIGLHGTGGSGAQFERDYLFSRKADEEGFIAVYPNGVRSNGMLAIRTWNAGSCCDYAMSKNIDDVTFISELIDQLIADYRVDPKRVYVTGMSNGGMMAYRLATEIPDKLAAIAPVSSTLVYTPAAYPNRTVPVLHLHSVLDKIVPYEGGTNPMGYVFPPVDSILHAWAKRNDDYAELRVSNNSDYAKKEWLNDTGNPLATLYVTNDGGHAWPGSKQVRPQADRPSRAIDANALIWDFFEQHTLPN